LTFQEWQDLSWNDPGPARNADVLEVVTIVRDDGSELAIHVMKMRPKYRRLLLGE
jgi:hypothetical protein